MREVREAAAQEERTRLARDLHDSIKQQLFRINIAAATTAARLESDPAGARSALEDVRRGAHEAMTEMEAMLQQLQPTLLAKAGLVEALRKQCEALQFRTGAQVTTELDPLPSASLLPAGAAEALFRIAQEALANVARHARADNVTVRLARSREDENVLELVVTDDGRGLNAALAPGMGLSNMRHRAQEIGAELEIGSARERGTCVRVCLSLPDEQEQDLQRRVRRVWLDGVGKYIAFAAMAWWAHLIFVAIGVIGASLRSRLERRAGDELYQLAARRGPQAPAVLRAQAELDANRILSWLVGYVAATVAFSGTRAQQASWNLPLVGAVRVATVALSVFAIYVTFQLVFHEGRRWLVTLRDMHRVMSPFAFRRAVGVIASWSAAHVAMIAVGSSIVIQRHGLTPVLLFPAMVVLAFAVILGVWSMAAPRPVIAPSANR
jgi:two-component sensor histidine kinase